MEFLLLGKFNGWCCCPLIFGPSPPGGRRAAGFPGGSQDSGQVIGGEGLKLTKFRTMKRCRSRSKPVIEFAREQRRAANSFASMVWQWIRNRQIFGQKFRREFPIPPYTADCCCVELRLVLEIDGGSHFTHDGREYDRVRDEFLGRCGYRILRIPGYDVACDDGKVIQSIRQFVQAAMSSGENASSSSNSPIA